MTSARLSTFSIVACDLDAGEWGVGVASKFLAVGSVVPWVRAGVGAVATQAYANTTYGPIGLGLMEQGYAAEEAVAGLVAADSERDQRQVGVVDAQGRAATFTGGECDAWAGGRTGDGYAAQGNILAGERVVEALAQAFEASSGPLADRLLAALIAGQEAGGDRRGKQSAALSVARRGGGYAGFNDRSVDLRVDDHAAPLDELRRLLTMHHLYMDPTRPEDVLVIDAQVAATIQSMLQRSGHRTSEPTGTYDEETRRSFRRLCGAENLEGRWRDGPEIDRAVLEYLGDRYGTRE